MIDALLRFVDNLGITPGFALIFGAGAALGSAVWLLSDRRRAEPIADYPGNMPVGEFVARVTLHSTQGRVFLWASAANLALAAVVPFLGDRVRDAQGFAILAACWPVTLFVLHVACSMRRYRDSWFSVCMLSTAALMPAWRVFVVDLLGIR